MIMLSADYRIRPLDHLQWILEQRKQTKAGRLERAGGEWRPYAYCRTKIGLETALSRLKCEGASLDRSLIAHLPDYFEPKDQSDGKINQTSRICESAIQD